MHVLIALSSVGVSTLALVKPSAKKLLVSYVFIAATTISGGYLIFTSTGDMLRSCIVGLAYVSVVSLMTVAAHVRIRTHALSA